MTSMQIVLYGVLAAFLFLYVRRVVRIRSLKYYSPAELQDAMRSRTDIVLMDVRTDEERRAGSIKGSIHIPMHQIRRRIDELARHRGKEIVCYCQNGNRSVTAALKLKKHGYVSANLSGGIGEWNFETRR